MQNLYLKFERVAYYPVIASKRLGHEWHLETFASQGQVDAGTPFKGYVLISLGLSIIIFRVNHRYPTAARDPGCCRQSGGGEVPETGYFSVAAPPLL